MNNTVKTGICPECKRPYGASKSNDEMSKQKNKSSCLGTLIWTIVILGFFALLLLMLAMSMSVAP